MTRMFLASYRAASTRAGRIGRFSSVVRVMSNLWIVPGSPALVAELSPDPASRRLHDAVRRLADTAGGRPIDIVCSLDEHWRTGITGSFQAWGAPNARVRAGHHLGELVARYSLGDPEVREVRSAIGGIDREAVTVVVLDGPAGLTQRAPLALIDGAPQLHERLKRWLGGGGPEVVDKHSVLEPALWEELATVRAERARLIDSDDTLGVGRYVAEWWV